MTLSPTSLPFLQINQKWKKFGGISEKFNSIPLDLTLLWIYNIGRLLGLGGGIKDDLET